MLPGYNAQRVEEGWWAFSVKKQSDYDTAVLDADLTYTHPVKDPKVADVTKEIRSDKSSFGKGHEFATNQWEVARDVKMSRNFDGSSLILGWALAFCLGKVVTTNPSGSVYRHQMYFFDPDVESTCSLPVTSAVESVTAGIKRILRGLAFSQVTLSAEGFEQINVAAEMIGSGFTAASTLAIPSMPTLSYLASSAATIKLGNAAEDISTRVRSWSVVFNNNPRVARGYFPGSGLYRGRMEIGSRTAIPSLVVDVDATDDIMADFLAGTAIALEINCDGATIGGTYKHYLKIIFPDLYYRATPLEEKDGMYTYALNFDEESVMYNSSRTVPLCEVIIQNQTPNYLVSSV